MTKLAFYRTLREANLARQVEWEKGNKLTLAHRGNELAGELGEALEQALAFITLAIAAGKASNIVKKLERERLGIGGSRETVANLADELADVVICADLTAMQAGIDLLGVAVPTKFNVTSAKLGLKTRLELPDRADPSEETENGQN